MIEAVRDPQLANGSSFVITTGIQQLPFELAGRTWDDARDELTRVTVDTITRYAPTSPVVSSRRGPSHRSTWSGTME